MPLLISRRAFRVSSLLLCFLALESALFACTDDIAGPEKPLTRLSLRPGALTDAEAAETRIVFRMRDQFLLPTEHITQLYIMRGDGSDIRGLTMNRLWWDDDPALSPDGSRIAFRRIDRSAGDQRSSDIYVMDVDGGNLTRLTTTGQALCCSDVTFINSDPAWSPDGRRIAFAGWTDMASHTDIYVIDADGTNLRRVTSDATYEGQPGWSPDGTRIVFAAGPHQFTEYTYGLRGLVVVSADGSGRQELTPDPPPWGSPCRRTTSIRHGRPTARRSCLRRVAEVDRALRS